MTDKPYTPTTEQVRDGFRYDELAEWYDPVTPHHVINGRAFDRWLATIEAAAEQRGAVKALREFADAHRVPYVMFRGENYEVTVSDLLRETARDIEQGSRADLLEGDE